MQIRGLFDNETVKKFEAANRFFLTNQKDNGLIQLPTVSSDN